MPIDWLTPAAALLTGLMGGAHCAAMCGGIAAGFSALPGEGGWRRALEPNLGRIAGYTLAGALAGGLGYGIVGLAQTDWIAPAAGTIWLAATMPGPSCMRPSRSACTTGKR